MSSLFGTLSIGKQAMNAAQLGLTVTSDNIANANTVGYSRQRIRFGAGEPIPYAHGMYESGVNIRGVDRLRNLAIDERIRSQMSSYNYYRETRFLYSQIEIALQDTLGISASDLDELNETGVNRAMLRLFNAFDELSLEPESSQARAVVIQEAQNLVATFGTTSGELTRLRNDLNNQIRLVVKEVNTKLEQVAFLNGRIAALEGGIRSANTLRDEREQILKEISELIPIRVTEQESGSVNVTLYGMGLVNAQNVKPLETRQREGDPNRSLDIMLSGNQAILFNSLLDGGKLGALTQARDYLIPDVQSRIDTLAKSLIQEVNRIHAGSVGLEGFTEVTAQYAATNSGYPLGAAGYPFDIQNGTFKIRLTDESGNEVGIYEIAVNPTTDSLQDIANRIEAADGVVGGGTLRATVTASGRLSISTDSGHRLTFQEDTSHFLSSIGINNFFDGYNAESIRVSDRILRNPNLIAASATGEPGGSEAAQAISLLRSQRVMENGSASLLDYYQSLVGTLGSQAQRQTQLEGNSQLLMESLSHRQEELAGVNVDEEAVELLKYQRSFQAAARLITAVDEMLATVIERTGLAGR